MVGTRTIVFVLLPPSTGVSVCLSASEVVLGTSYAPKCFDLRSAFRKSPRRPRGLALSEKSVKANNQQVQHVSLAVYEHILFEFA